MKVYDKASWHYPSNCPNLNDAVHHLEIVIEWLDEHDLLNDEGHEIVNLGIDEEAALTSEMLTEKGEKVIDEAYDDWLDGVEYGTSPSTERLDATLRKY